MKGLYESILDSDEHSKNRIDDYTILSNYVTDIFKALKVLERNSTISNQVLKNRPESKAFRNVTIKQLTEILDELYDNRTIKLLRTINHDTISKRRILDNLLDFDRTDFYFHHKKLPNDYCQIVVTYDDTIMTKLYNLVISPYGSKEFVNMFDEKMKEMLK